MKKITIFVSDQVADATEKAIDKLIDFVWDNNMEVFEYSVEEAEEDEIQAIMDKNEEE